MFEVDARGGFVQHEEIRLTRESPGNQDALLLPTRECRNVGIELLRQPNQSSGVADGVSICSGQWPKVLSVCQPSCRNDLFDLRPAEQRR